MSLRDSFLVSKEETKHPLKLACPASAREKESPLARLLSKFAKMKHPTRRRFRHRQWIMTRFGYM